MVQVEKISKLPNLRDEETMSPPHTHTPASSIRQGPCLFIPSPGHLIYKYVLKNKLMNVNECFHIHLSFTRVFPIHMFTEHLWYLGLQK